MPLLLETFINVGEEDQRSDYAAFAEQEEIPLLFYDQFHQHRLAKTVGNGSRQQIPRVLQAAEETASRYPNRSTGLRSRQGRRHARRPSRTRERSVGIQLMGFMRLRRIRED